MQENYENCNNVNLTDDDIEHLFDNQETLDLDGIEDFGCQVSSSQIKVKYSHLSDFPRIVHSILEVKDLELSISFIRMCGYQFLFRGLPNASYDLLPTIVWNKVENYDQEKEILNELIEICKKYEYEDFRHPSFNKTLFYMAVGRHLGMHSRLMDWSASMWKSISFLMNDKDGLLENDGALWILAYPHKSVQPEKITPFSFTDHKIHVLREDYYLPDDRDLPIGIKRMDHQNGFFTVQPEDLLDVPIENLVASSGMELIKVIIPKETKALLKGYKELVDLRWMYVDENEPIIEEVKQLNDKFMIKEPVLPRSAGCAIR